MSSFIGIVIIVFVTAIDNALLAGVVVPRMEDEDKRKVFVAVGILLGISEIFCSAGVDYLMKHLFFQIAAIVVLAWMSVRTLGFESTRSVQSIGMIVRLFLFTLVGNLDNIIWLGSTLKGDRFWLIASSLLSIPLFVWTAMFLSRQIEKQKWILPLGAGMMAWAASALTLDIPVFQSALRGLDDAPSVTFQCLLTAAILVIGLWIRHLLSPRKTT